MIDYLDLLPLRRLLNSKPRRSGLTTLGIQSDMMNVG
jgi:hypothetical protein